MMYLPYIQPITLPFSILYPPKKNLLSFLKKELRPSSLLYLYHFVKSVSHLPNDWKHPVLSLPIGIGYKSSWCSTEIPATGKIQNVFICVSNSDWSSQH